MSLFGKRIGPYHILDLIGEGGMGQVYQNGKTQPLRATADYNNIRFSPDGRRVAMDIVDQGYDIWIYEWARDTMSRLTFDPSGDRSPIWTPDGRRIAFWSQRDKSPGNLYWQRADGTGEPQRLTESTNSQIPESWHPNGKFLTFREFRPQTGFDLMILPMDGDETSGWKPGKPAVFLEGPFDIGQVLFSTGRTIVFQ